MPLLGIAIVTGHPPTAAIAFLPIGILLVGLMTLGAGLLLAPLSVIFSDTVEVITIVLSLLLYMTPVFYPRAIVPEQLRWAVRLNPLAAALEVFRAPIRRPCPAGADRSRCRDRRRHRAAGRRFVVLRGVEPPPRPVPLRCPPTPI